MLDFKRKITMNDDFLPYSLPEIGEEEIAEVVNTLKSGWITTGPKAKTFEKRFQDFLGGDVETIAVSSATAGLHLALEAFGIGPGDEVITTTHTFTATAEVVRYLGADVRFVDINPSTLNIDVTKITENISNKTKAIIVVHFAGLSCEMNEIFAIAKKYNLKVIEDAAHALPTSFEGKLVGALESDATIFSFYANKSITTGEGGMVVTRNHDAASHMRIMRLHGIDRDAYDRFNTKKPSWYYEIVAPGYKYNMSDIAASIGIQQLLKIMRFSEKRNEMANMYFECLSELPVILPARPNENDMHAWHIFVLQITTQSKYSRDEVIDCLSKKGIGTSVHYIPLHRQPYWRDRYNLRSEMFPVSDAVYKTSLSIPLYTSMKRHDQDRVITALKEILS